MRLSYLPNLITIGRIIALIPLVWFMMEKQYFYALIVMIAAGISDGLDGYLAKRYGWQGWIGGVLDPLADKFMMLCCYMVFAVQEVIPHWLLILVLSRDIIIITGATIYHFLVGKIEEAQPTMISKINTVLQILLVLLLLVDLSLLWAVPEWLETTMITLVALFTAASGLDYMIRWGSRAFSAEKNRRPDD